MKKSTRKELIAKGRFSIVDLTENSKYNAMVKKIPSNTPNYGELVRQVKKAFMFEDEEMILELDSFISNNISTQKSLFNSICG